MGTAILTGKPPATSPTIIDVTVLEDWISAVATMPITSPVIGLLAKLNSSFAVSPADSSNPLPIVATAINKR
jgi:hypothetical protein